MKNHQLLTFLLMALIYIMACSSHSVGQDKEIIYFKRIYEPNEKAFSVLLPAGWHTKGGIFRLDPSVIGGAGNAIAAKYDFAVYNNVNADVQIRWLPDYLFFDMRYSPAAGMFPAGSNYNGMEVRPKTDAVSFILNVAIPFAHPDISNVKKTGQKQLPGLANAYRNYAAKMPMSTMNYDAALVKFEYNENGKQYEEIIMAVVEDWGQMGAGLWGNKNCMFLRAPKEELEKWAPILETIHTSVEIDITWLKGEINGQQVRGGKMLEVQQQMQNIDREITAHQQKINYEIHNDMYLTLTSQEEYINPYTNKVEIGTNQWQHRWQNDLGEIIYTDIENYNPNIDPNLQVSGFKRSAIRKR
ncbi:hypothetical protein N9164_00640 [Draconibacterium sp.]|nr:hypothetical protein [Draconibacterium sp.]